MRGDEEPTHQVWAEWVMKLLVIVSPCQSATLFLLRPSCLLLSSTNTHPAY